MTTDGAPIVYFDGIEVWAIQVGTGHLTLTASRRVREGSTTKVVHMTAAHLRFPIAVLPALREAIDKIQLAIAEPAGKRPT